MSDIEKHWDSNSEENSSKHHVGLPCIERGCSKPAGTAWSDYWCWECNAKRLDRITKSIKEIEAAIYE